MPNSWPDGWANYGGVKKPPFQRYGDGGHIETKRSKPRESQLFVKGVHFRIDVSRAPTPVSLSTARKSAVLAAATEVREQKAAYIADSLSGNEVAAKLLRTFGWSKEWKGSLRGIQKTRCRPKGSEKVGVRTGQMSLLSRRRDTSMHSNMIISHFLEGPEGLPGQDHGSLG
ncbi:unnamed protein product [Heligmosomoides polygyrus]|uniref:N-acetyltransferase domain-containing protein n=1 Tax=Heligmosomoides polygyrus TaxID=6339 RepID=A0A183FW49_HELPZ|nr:unnamed protein product [Heligmosomoides polygyrus]